jgi:hypothetical protein
MLSVACLAWFNVCGLGHELTLEWSNERCFTWIGFGLTDTHYLRMERHAKDKNSSLM